MHARTDRRRAAAVRAACGRHELRLVGVAVLDREREWHVIGKDGYGRPGGDAVEPYGGYGGAHNMGERFGARGHDYKRGDDGGAPVDEAKVNEMLAARLHARLNRDFVAADRMREQLRTEHGIEVYDAEREWKVAADGGGGSGGNGSSRMPMATDGGAAEGSRYERRRGDDEGDDA